MRSKVVRWGTVGTLLVTAFGQASAPVQAEELQNNDGRVGWGPISIYPTLEVRLVYDDNVLLQETDKRSSFVTVVSPDLGLTIDTSLEYGTEAGFKVGAEYVSYDNSLEDGYLNLHALFEIDSEPADGFGLYGSVGWELGHDPLGTAGMQGPSALYYDEAAEYQLWWIKGRADYAFSSSDQLVFEATREEREYQNYRTAADGISPGLGRLRDVTATNLSLSLQHQLQPNTVMVGGVTWTDYDYRYANLDSEELGYFIGLEWDITYQTEGYAHVGWSKKDMKDPARVDGQMFSWDVGVNWKPMSYSTIHLGAYGRFEEADGGGDFREVRGVDLDWNHNWTSYLRSLVGVSYHQDDYNNYAVILGNSNQIFRDRSDEVLEFRLGAYYQMRRWLSIGAEYNYANRDSNIPGYSYEDNRFQIVLRAGLFDAIGEWTRDGVL